MNGNRTVFEARRIQDHLKKFKTDMRQWEKDEIEYREWCEGLIMAAIATLGVITGD